jgi:hypothetical protein
LKKLDAGQFQATIVADVSPDAAGPIIDQLAAPGAAWNRSSTPRSSGSTGSIIAGSLSLSVTCHLQSSKKRTIVNSRVRQWLLDSNHGVSGIPGAVHIRWNNHGHI